MIKVNHLTKKFGAFTAVDNLSFAVAPGEAVALWGPNGAGKTTVIRCLLGLLSAKGELRLNSFDAQREGKKARGAVGYVPQELAFYDDLSARETLRFYANLKGVPTARVDQTLAEVGLSEHIHKSVAALSGGMKQRLALAIALLIASVAKVGAEVSVMVGDLHFAFQVGPSQSVPIAPTFLACDASGGSCSGG